MTTFMTKVWGFDDPVGPLQFASEGWRRNALDKLQDGDRVVLVGTQGPETQPEERGRVLGIMEPTRQLVRSLDFPLRRSDTDMNAAGEYKWPYGLYNRRAWLLLERPLLTEISDRSFGMDAAQGIVPLTPAEAARIDRLRRTKVGLLEPLAHARERLDREQGGQVRRGPPPSSTLRRGVMHMRSAPASTYAMELCGARPVAIKVGWAFDPLRRRDQFNQAAMPALGGLRYRISLTQRWSSARQAYSFEQSVLRHFGRFLASTNREIVVGVRVADFDMAWARLVSETLRQAA